MRVMVVGAGYVGLTTAVVLSTKHHVTIVETNSQKIKAVNAGECPFHEKGLDPLLKDAIVGKRLRAIGPNDEYTNHDFVIICVGTPARRDGSVNLDNLEAAVSNIQNASATLIDEYLVIVIRSTIPPTTTRRMVIDPLSEELSPESFGVIFNPEFMRQGFAIHDITSPERIVIGSSTSKAAQMYRELYSSVLDNEDTRIIETSIESAELCKYASNCFLATKISFTNEISSIAEVIKNIDIDAVMTGVTADNRINPSHMSAGLGFGGTCLPKDLSGLIAFGKQLGLSMDLLSSVATINENMDKRLMKLLNGKGMDLSGRKVAVLGLTFKAGTDDTRASQSLDVIRRLHETGAVVWAHDPMASNLTLPNDVKGMFRRCDEISQCTEDAHAIFLMTDWPVYRDIGIQGLVSNMKKKLFIDGRRQFAKSPIPPGVEYLALGSNRDFFET